MSMRHDLENALGLCEGVEIAIEYRWSQPFSLQKLKVKNLTAAMAGRIPVLKAENGLHAFSMKPLMFLDKAYVHLIHRLLS